MLPATIILVFPTLTNQHPTGFISKNVTKLPNFLVTKETSKCSQLFFVCSFLCHLVVFLI